MIPNKGYQQIIVTGFFAKIGLITIQFKPEYIFAENLNFNGFWEGHYEYHWAQRYHSWNMIDTPERFGHKSLSFFNLGQSSIRFNYKKLKV